MEKQELSYSDCMAFIEYIRKAMKGVIARDYEAVYENIDSARDMITDWRYDGEILLSDYAFLTQRLNQAIAALCIRDEAVLLFTLMKIKDCIREMMVRQNYGCKIL